ncbi:oxidation resistance protein 1-like isoform X1 [Sycon ciliatum]|uniref:oxidation resistance protein 1-like isoform X1 n=2 Tax=Sycon ciliatum TaxID=27933 RepID=UPI0031F642F2
MATTHERKRPSVVSTGSGGMRDTVAAAGAGAAGGAGVEVHQSALGSPPSRISPSVLRRLADTPGLMLYEVSDRDTFPSVAVRFNTTPSSLQQLNKLTSRNIFPGQHIVVPDPVSLGNTRRGSDVAETTLTTRLPCSQTSSGVSSCDSERSALSPVSAVPTSSCQSVGEVTSACSTSSSCTSLKSPSAVASGAAVANRSKISSVGTKESVSSPSSSLHVVESYFSDVDEVDDLPVIRNKPSAMLPSNQEPPPLEIITDSLVAIDAQIVNVEEGIARGTLRLTRDRIDFQPWGADRLVRSVGADSFVCSMHFSSVTSLGMFPDLVKMSVLDKPVPMSRSRSQTSDFLFVSCDEWSLIAPRAHCTLSTETPAPASQPSAQRPSQATTQQQQPSPSAGASRDNKDNNGLPVLQTATSSSTGARPSPAMRLRAIAASFTPPLVRASSNGSRSAPSPAPSPGKSPMQRQTSGSSDTKSSGLTTAGPTGSGSSIGRSPNKRKGLFRQRSSTLDDDMSRPALQHMSLPGYLCMRTQPLSQETSEPEKEHVFAIPGAKKQLVFDFLCHNIRKLKNVPFSEISLLYNNLRSNAANSSSGAANGNGVGGVAGVPDAVVGGVEVTSAPVGSVGTSTSVPGGMVRVVSSGSDVSPHHYPSDYAVVSMKKRSQSMGSDPRSAGSMAARSLSIEEGWYYLEPSDLDPPKPARTLSMQETPSLSTESKILSVKQLEQLSKEMPLHLLGQTWRLCYSTYVHGISLQTMFRNCLKSTEGPVLLVIRDTAQHVFGVLSSCTFRISDTFQGNGTSFLYTFRQSDTLEVFRWTGENSFFLKGDKDCMSYGGGRGKFGLWLDADLYHGASDSCPTFDNPCLASKTDFLIAGVEVWYFASC